MFPFERNTAFILYGSLPGDCHASLAMTQYFVRNITRVCLPKSICRIFALSLFYPVQRTLCHCEALPTAMPWQSPGRDTLLTPRKILLYLRGEKGAHKQKSERYLPDNAISKAQCAPRGKTIPPQLRWYCLLMCFRIKELWIVICVNFGARGDFRPVCRSTARRLPLSFRSPKSLQEGFRPHTGCTCRWLQVRALTGLSPAPVF